MVPPHISRLATAAALVSIAQGQAIWQKNQVNTRICQWIQPRAALLQDTVYLDGGIIWWSPGLSDGSIASAVSDDNPLGLIYTLNFSKPFKTADNITAQFDTLAKGIAGGAASNLAPNYVDGAILANDHEWFLYGGLLRKTNEYKPPPGDSVLGYQQSQYGVDKPQFLSGFVNKELPEDVTRYIAYGGAANVPSEDKAFYFSGMTSSTKGEIFQTGATPTANVTSNTLIVLDMKTQQQEEWRNTTLPSRIKGRANPELVWVPVGKQGILVSLGGVVFPDFATVSGSSSNKSESEKTSPSFMSTIDIYDVESGDWFSQPTEGGPGQLTRGCAVVARAQDNSSFNIYYYGGYDGLSSQANDFNDEVWVLSLPSFTWTRVAEGTGNGRAGHKCFMPYPDRMMAIGGFMKRVGGVVTCLKETIRVFDVNTAKWLEEYDPSKYSEYLIPEAILKKIGGTATGGATMKTPSGGWDDDALGDVFGTSYPTDRIKVYYPYSVQQPPNNTNPNVPPNKEEGGGGGVPKFLPPVLGVVLGLMFLTMIAVLILLWRRRKMLKSTRGGMSDAGTEDTNGHRIMSWMRGQTSEAKAPTVATSDYNLPASPADAESVAHTLAPQPSMAEIMGREIHHPVELMDTSPRAELYDTGLSHTDVINRYSHLGESPATQSLNNPSSYTHTSQMDHASTLSQSTSSAINGPTTQQGFSPYDYRPDSDLLTNPFVSTQSPASAHTASPAPALATVSETEVATHSDPSVLTTSRPGAPRVLSGLSNISDRDRSHLRQISDTSVSSVTTHQGGVPGERILISPEPGQQAAQTAHHPMVTSPGPVSPPTAGVDGEGADDYLSARPSGAGVVVSPLVGNLYPPPPIGGDGSGAQHVVRRSGSGGGGTGSGSPLRRSVFHESREDMTDDTRPGVPREV